MVLAVSGLFIVSLAWIIARNNFICKTIGIIGLVVGEVLTIIGTMGIVEGDNSLPVALAIGAVIAGGQRIGMNPLGRAWNKPTSIKRLFSMTGIILLIASIAVVALQVSK